MSDHSDSPLPAPLDVADVVSSSIALARSHWDHLLAIALGCALPGALLGVARVGLGGARATLAAGAWVHDPVIAALMVAQFVVLPCLSAATVLYVTRSALLALEDRPATRKETLEVMRGAWVRSLVVSFVSYVGSLLAFFLCFVPGCFWVAAFLVAVPASLAEGCGVTEAFGRAAELTRGRRGGVFLAYLAFSVPILLAAIPLIAVYFTMIVQATHAGAASATGLEAASTSLQLALVAAAIPVTFVGELGKAYAYAVVYARLRGVTPRLNAPGVASVFA